MRRNFQWRKLWYVCAISSLIKKKEPFNADWLLICNHRLVIPRLEHCLIFRNWAILAFQSVIDSSQFNWVESMLQYYIYRSVDWFESYGLESIGFGFCTAHTVCTQSIVSIHLPSIWFDSNYPDQIVERLTEPIGSLREKAIRVDWK